MNVGKTLFAQIMEFLPWRTFNRIVARYSGDHRVRTLKCAEQYRCMAFAQLTYRESLRDIEACLSAQAAPFRTTKAAATLHTLLDLRGSIPSFIHIFDGKLHDVNVLDLLIPEPGAFYVMDRGCLDFERLHVLHGFGSFFVTRAKSNMDARRIYSHPCARTTGVICDQSIALNGFYSSQHYPEHLRRIRYKDPDSNKKLIFLTDHFGLPALTICALYRSRWQVELFFKWIKQHLRIHRFYGTSENAVSQDPDLDRGVGLRAHRHRQEAAQPRRLSSHAATDPLGDPLRETPAAAST